MGNHLAPSTYAAIRSSAGTRTRHLWQNLWYYMVHMYLSLSSRLLIAVHASHKTPKVCRVSSGDPNHPLLFFQTGSIIDDNAELQ
jgi:sterol desaturase/sphingolipid hydroxylase (fatty acid hydroxylase superfamily)